jgi:hypothetical protein
VRLDLAEVLFRAGERDEFRRVADEALAIYDAKGDVAGRRWAERRLADTTAVVSQ